MPRLVDDDPFGHVRVRRCEPARTCGDEGRVLHSRRTALPRRIDDGQVAVRIRPEPLAVVFQRRARGGEMAVGLVGMLGLKEQPDVDRRQAALRKRRVPFEKMRARRPGKIVDVVLEVAVGGGQAVRLVPALALDPRGPDDPPLWHRQADVISAEVGEELGPGVELVRVPSGVLEHADFREPLARRSRSHRWCRCVRTCGAHAPTMRSGR